MIYTVQHLARLAGVTVRTLHHYDEIGLLKPSFVRANGYRVYEDRQVWRLRQILLLRELSFPLSHIQRMLSDETFDVRSVLSDQRQLLELKKKRIQMLIDMVDTQLKGGESMTDAANILKPFTDKTMDAYKKEAYERWGKTDAYKQSQERTKNWTKADYETVARDGAALTAELSKLMDRGIEDEDVQKLINKHYESIQQFYDCPMDMYVQLGQMYVDDARFTAYYDKFRPGMAVFMRDAIAYFVHMRTHAT